MIPAALWLGLELDVRGPHLGNIALLRVGEGFLFGVGDRFNRRGAPVLTRR
jgi:hypothetical protein